MRTSRYVLTVDKHSDQILNQLNKLQEVRNSVSLLNKHSKTKHYVKCQGRWGRKNHNYNNRAIPELDWNWLSDKMFQMVQLVNDKSFKFDIQEIDKELKYIEYGFGGHYNWHMDLNPTDSNTRKLTAVVQLNDEYEGGYLEFGVQDRKGEWFKVPKMKGSITIFPCFLSHRVSPVTKGKRHVVQELYLGDAFV